MNHIMSSIFHAHAMAVQYLKLQKTLQLLCFVLQENIGISALCRYHQLHRKRRALSILFTVFRNCRWIYVPLPKRHCLRSTWFNFTNSCVMHVWRVLIWRVSMVLFYLLLTSVLYSYFYIFLQNCLFTNQYPMP